MSDIGRWQDRGMVMTVRELIEALEGLDPNAQLVGVERIWEGA